MGNTVVEFGEVNSTEIRRFYQDSYFLDEECDAAIMGVNPLTNAIIYHYYQLIHIEISNNENEDLEQDSDEWNDLYDHCMEIVNSKFYGLENNTGDLVAPTLFQELLTL